MEEVESYWGDDVNPVAPAAGQAVNASGAKFENGGKNGKEAAGREDVTRGTEIGGTGWDAESDGGILQKIIRGKGEEEGGFEKSDTVSSEVADNGATDEKYAKLEKRFKDTQGSFHQLSKKLSFHEKSVKDMEAAVKGMLEAGELDDDVAEKLLGGIGGLLNNVEHEKPVEGMYNHDVDDVFLSLVGTVKAYEEMHDEIPVRKYVDTLLHALDNRSGDDVLDAVYRELTSVSEKPALRVKRMVELGKQIYESEYKDIEEAGGYKQYVDGAKKKVQKYERELQKKDQKIQELEKTIVELKQTGDYVKGSLPSGSAYGAKQTLQSGNIESFFD